MSAPEKAPEGQKEEPARVAQTRKARRRRDDMGPEGNMKLGFPASAKDPNYVERWINDTVGGRIQEKTQFDDWDIVTTDQLNGYQPSPRDIGEGSQIKRVVGVVDGQPQYAYLCRKPKDYHQADEAKKQAAIDALEEEMRRSPNPHRDGDTANVAYVPNGANVIERG